MAFEIEKSFKNKKNLKLIGKANDQTTIRKEKSALLVSESQGETFSFHTRLTSSSKTLLASISTYFLNSLLQ